MALQTRQVIAPVASFTAALSLGVAGGAAASTDEQRAPETQHPLTTVPPPDSAAGKPRQGQADVTGDGSCSAIPSSARDAAGGAVEGCVEFTSPRTGSASRTDATFLSATAEETGEAASTLAAEEPEDPEDIDPGMDDPIVEEPVTPTACSVTPGVWTWTRTGGMCLSGQQVTYTLYDENGKQVGRGFLQVSSKLETSCKSTDIREQITVKVTGVEGRVTSLNVKMTVDCASDCTTTMRTPWWGTRTLTQGQSATGEVTYDGAVPSAKTRFSFQTQYKLYVTATGATPVDPNATWDSPATAMIRCDTEMPTLTGCVIPDPDVDPVLEFSLSDPVHASASAGYLFAQRQRNWAPLHGINSANKSIANNNRKYTCGSRSSDKFQNLFPGLSGVDSCDEQCIRAHITLQSNISAGGKYSSFKQMNRIVDKDPFLANIVA
ncbi:hypothetical protein [Streptomyces sp. NPDC002845]